ncbi:DctP family TRAP transporter solute-binding subunit [Desulfofustis glycolicus]|uniref:C4-dicarboxylate-binding protein DctP n=1 Tax=Desulfofustis glycolicus DSM 9705 TaxID=1121409 RepID=A0A1M5VH81_9BACT|nr:DctP family TRAP transporter solute-binding subunit [Desulfofustis glycolicus]MCB2217582.1 DctP family TRAP transporter solute-binding subunit [Desulfobulbaceae bacterium]SHH74570.1 C4-dicarboxylate-binding protein DctP [Desulfofustis glycolicus DSM 9705]
MFRTFFPVFVCYCLLFAAANIGWAAPTVIRFTHVVGNDTPKGQAALKFKDIVAERMWGRFVVEVYPNSTLFDDDQVFEAVLLDDVQMAAPSMSKFSLITKKLRVFDLPFLFQDMTAVELFQNSVEGQDLLTSFSDRGLIGLGYLHNGMKQLSANRQLSVPQDAAGLKFRVQPSDVLKAQFTAIGAEAVPKPFSQVYSLLSNGVVDGQENTWSNIYSKKFHTVQTHITESNHGVIDYMVVTSRNFWESLSPEDQRDLRTALNEAIAFANSLADKNQQDSRQHVIDSGEATVVQLSKDERAMWVEAMRPVWRQFEADIGKELIDKAVSANQ